MLCHVINQTVAECKPPPDVPNGNYSLYDDGRTVQYTCARGYSLAGDSVRSCDVAGQGWSGNQPSCGE